jgi:hypothetical protein
MNKIEPDDCTGSVKGGHSEAEYQTIGLSPCGEYVAHWIEKSCAGVEDIKDHSEPESVHICQCREGVCPCGSFISHKVSEPCSAVEN